MKDGKIIGWDFKKAYNADGGTTIDSLKAERSKLEARLKQIPIEIANLSNTIKLRVEDINWLRSISKRKLKKWEKEKGVDANTQIYRVEQAIVDFRARIASMQTEQKRIPSQISTITSQINTLIKGESTGLEKGIDRETAKELGQIELQKERDRMEHERALRKAQLEEDKIEAAKQAAAQQRRQESEKQVAKKEASEQSQKNWLIGIGAVVVLGIIAWIIYKRRLAAKALTT